VLPAHGVPGAVADSTVQTPLVPQPLRLIDSTVAIPLPPLFEIVIAIDALQVVARPGSVRVLAAVSATTVSLPTSSTPPNFQTGLALALLAIAALAVSSATTLSIDIQVIRFRISIRLPYFDVPE
jgi:hypothetical protein